MVFEGHKLPVGLPLAPSSDEVGERCVAQLARTFREDTMYAPHLYPFIIF